MLNLPISSWRNQLISPCQNFPDYHREPSGAKRLQTIRMPALFLSLKSELSSRSSLWHDTTPHLQFPPTPTKLVQILHEIVKNRGVPISKISPPSDVFLATLPIRETAAGT